MRLGRSWGGSLPLLVRMAGLIWIGTLVLRISDGTFFVGDAGLKFLQVEQFAHGRLELSLNLGEPAFAKGPYQDGFFPFEKPFVYRIDGRFYSAFPVLFQALTAPFAAWLGFRGLYAWPLLGLWLAWAAVDRLAVTCELGPAYRAVALVLLIFCSPLSLYGAVFWEHSLAVGLVSVGWAMLSAASSGAGAHRAAHGFAAGLAFGSAVWLREEILLLAVLVGLASLRGLLTEPETRRTRVAQLAGLAAPVLLWLAFNRVAYGTLSGLRALQLDLAPTSAWDPAPVKALLFRLADSLVAFFPPVLLLGGLLATLRRNAPSIAPLRGPLLIGLAFFCLLPLGLPNDGGKQWGPRYLLPLIPLAAAALGALLNEAFQRSPRLWGPGVALLLAALAAPGLRLNFVEGSQAVIGNSLFRAESLRPVLADPRSIVVVSHQYTSQQLASAFGEKTFFLAPTGRGLKRLADQLAVSRRREFLYLFDPVYPGPRALDGLPEWADVAGDYGSSTVTLSRLGEWGRYVAYRGEIVAR